MFSEKYAKEIRGQFARTAARLGRAGDRIREKIEKEEEALRPALEFLYASMPDSDIFDYPYELYREYALHGLCLWNEQEENARGWTRVPEKLFANYVLHHRANNEDLAGDRAFFYEKLRDVTAHLTMREAAIAVNYWLAQTASYQTTDDRTASGKTVYRSGLGRCGEESVYAVTAYRSIGIPARQVYVPLWSHCDDNHAWVEVWCDGEWSFLGACEPEEILNRGWFTAASSRAMQVQSRWLGCDVPEDAVVGKKGMSLVVNHLDLYARSKTLKLRVRREDGSPAADAEVILSVLNYGAFGEIARVCTDADGRAQVRLGLGSVRAECGDGDAYGEAYADMRSQDTLILTLKKEPFAFDVWEEYKLYAPKAQPVNAHPLTEEQKRAGETKLRAAKERREERIRGFFREEEAKRALKYCPKPEAGIRALEAARGNFDAVCGFLKWEEEDQELWRFKLGLLGELREKDFWDLDAGILRAHLEAVRAYAVDPKIPKEIYDSCILNPRVDRELLSAYAPFIRSYFTEEEQTEFRRSPEKLWRWVQEEIVSDAEREYSNLVTGPENCLRSRRGSAWSKAVLSVAICRSLGIPARFNPVDKTPEYFREGRFVSMAEAPNGAQADIRTASFSLKSDGKHPWEYARSFSVSRFQGKSFVPLDLEGDENPHRELPAEPGIYRVLTANRLPNGDVFAKKYDFLLRAGERREICLSMKEADLKEMLSEHRIPDIVLQDGRGERISVSGAADGRRTLLLWLEEGKEPTEHILGEMLAHAERFGRWQRDIFLITKENAPAEAGLLLRVGEALPDARLCYDDFGAQASALARSMFLEPESFPFVLVREADGAGSYASAGYNVGTADMLLRIWEESEAK